MTITLTARATDAGGLVTTKSLAVSVAAAQQSVSIFTTQAPAQVNQTDGSQLELGVKFQSSVAGTITGIRFWKGSSEGGGHIGRIWSASGTLLASVTFANETASGWQTQNLATPLPIQANTTYVVSVGTTNNFYVVSGSALNTAVSNGPLSTIAGGNGVFANRGAFPSTGSFNAGNYFRDVVFVPVNAAAAPPVVSVGSFSVSLPATSGATVGTMTATGSPTAWDITAGNAAGYFAIDNTGKITVTAAGAAGIAAGSYSLTVRATNASGSNTAIATISASTFTGWPDASTTGVPSNVTLTPYTGPMTVSASGTVIDGKNIPGRIDVTGANVTIRNCRIAYNDYFAMDITGINARIEWCDIIGPGDNGDSPGAVMIEASGATIYRCDISGAEHGIVLGPGTAQILENYVHDGGSNKEDPHIGGISLKGGQNGVLIQGNTVIGRDTADVFLQNNFGPISNVTINHNYLAGVPNYNIYVEGRLTGGPTTGVTITNNVLVKGQYDYYSIVDASPTISGNTTLLPGDPIPPP